MKKYEQYKDSGVAWIGEIPAHWDAIKPKYLVNLQKGTKPKELTDEMNGNLPYLTMDVLRDRANKTTTYPITVDDLVRVKDGDILVLWDGANAGEVLLAKDGYLSSTMARFGFDTDKLNSQYWFYFLKGLEPILKEFAGGTTIPHLDSSKIMEEVYPIPSSEEQNAIVRYLDYKVAKIDQLIAESEVQIEELGKYKTAMISEVVTKGLNPDAPMRDSGIEWIGQIPEHWAVKRIKYVGKAENGLTYAPNDICDDTEGTLVLRSSNIQNGKLAFDDNVFVRAVPDSLKVRKGDIIICSRNGSASLVGKSALVEEDIDACFGAFMMRFRSNLNSKYIHFLLTAAISHYKQLFTTTTINQLTIGLINNIAMPLIENITEQKVVVDYLDKKCADIDSAIKLLNDYVEQLKVYKTALISEAVTGQIDVRDWREK